MTNKKEPTAMLYINEFIITLYLKFYIFKKFSII